MEKKINELLQQAQEALGNDCDIMIVAHKEGKCGAVIHGKTDNVAQAVFACMHQPKQDIGPALYYVLKLNMMNILVNPSPYANNLMEAIVTISNGAEQAIKESEKPAKHKPRIVKLPTKNHKK